MILQVSETEILNQCRAFLPAFQWGKVGYQFVTIFYGYARIACIDARLCIEVSIFHSGKCGYEIKMNGESLKTVSIKSCMSLDAILAELRIKMRDLSQEFLALAGQDGP